MEFGDVVSQCRMRKSPHFWKLYQRQKQRTWSSWQVRGGEPIQSFVLEDPQRALNGE